MFIRRAVITLLITCTAHATESIDNCINGLSPCGLVLTPAPTPPLTSLNCNNPDQVTYTLINEGPTSVTLQNLTVTPNLDNTVDDAVSIGCGPSCCNTSLTLYGGGTTASQCLVYLNFAPCSTGLLDYTLTITPNSTQRPLNWNISATVGSGYNNAYVVNSLSNLVSYCLLNSDGTFGSGDAGSSSCTSMQALDNTSTNLLNSPWAMAVHPNGNFVYFSNQGDDSITVCPPTSPGVFGTCTKNIDPSFDQVYGIVANTVENGNILYVANRAANTISYCLINDLDGTLSDCSTAVAGDDTLGITPEDIVLLNQGHMVLITNNASNNVSIMMVDSVTGDLSFAENRTEPTLDSPVGIAFGGNFAYFTNDGNNTVAICDGSGCTPSADNANNLLSSPAGGFIAANSAYFSNLALGVSSPGYTITMCSINPSDGTLIDPSCTSLLDQSFDGPSDVLLTP